MELDKKLSLDTGWQQTGPGDGAVGLMCHMWWPAGHPGHPGTGSVATGTWDSDSLPAWPF